MARTKLGFLPIYTEDGTPPVTKWYPLVSGTYYEGSPVRVSASTGSAALMAAGGTTILGVSGSNVTTASSTSGKYPITLATPVQVFSAVQITAVAPQTRNTDVADLALSSGDYRISGTAVGATGVATAPWQIVGYDLDESASSHGTVTFYCKGNNTYFGLSRRTT